MARIDGQPGATPYIVPEGGVTRWEMAVRLRSGHPGQLVVRHYEDGDEVKVAIHGSAVEALLREDKR